MRPDNTPNSPSSVPQEKRPLSTPRRIIGYVLLSAALLIAWFLLIGFLGWQRGEQLRTENQQVALTEQIDRQKELAATNISDGQYDLATSRLEWVLEQNPNDTQATALLADVDSALADLYTPTPTPRFTPTPEPTREPTPTPGAISSPEDELQRIRRLMALKDWETAVPALYTFQISFPSYERQQTDQFLYNAYVELARDNIDGQNIELGLYYLNQAAVLGDLSQELRDYETWAELYLQGMAFYGANWDASAYYFRDLCLAAPFYQDACSRLQDALVAFGDQQAVAQEWCPAAELYQEASAYEFVPNLTEKLNQAVEMCALATPTPDGAAPDAPLDGTPTPETTPEDGENVDSFTFQTPTPTAVP